MAGRGSRFQPLATKDPRFSYKPFIPVLGSPMISWAVRSLNFVPLSDFIFIVLKDHEDQFQVTSTLRRLFSPAIKTVIIPDITRGAAESALQAGSAIEDANEDVVISDSDHFFDGEPLHQTILTKDEDTAGIIPVDLPVDDEIKHSYTLSRDDKTAVRIAEKDPELAAQGAYSNIGAYYFSSWSMFSDLIIDALANNQVSGPEGKKEFYMAPLYQKLLDQNKKIQIAVTKMAYRLGTPADLDYFNAHYQP